MRISDTETRFVSLFILLISFIGFITLGYENLTNSYNLLSILLFIGGFVTLIYDVNKISISYFPTSLRWVELETEYAISPSTKSEGYGLLRLFLKKSGYFKIILSEIIINTPDYFKMNIQVGTPTSNHKKEKSMDRLIYSIPMIKEIRRKGYLIGIDFRVKKSREDNIHNEEIDVIIKYDLNIKNYKILSCKKTISI